MSKIKFLNIIQNFSYTLASNLISLIISTLVILVIPKTIGVEEYGYWQLYLFYASYVGFLHFGWNDGIYLRYGGDRYENLDKKLFFSQFWMLFLFQLILSVFIFIGTNLIISSRNITFIFFMIAINLLLVNTRYMLVYLLQATNRMKEYSNSTILDRLVYIILIITFIILGIKEYQIMVFADLIGKFISFLYTVYICRDIVFRKISTFYFNFKEMFENIKVGIKLMFANIASTLILGIVKFGIQTMWSVEVFGKISLTLSISNLLTIFINALSLAIYPILRRTEVNKLSNVYNLIRTILMIPLLGLLIIYYPLKNMLVLWLPQYADSLRFMALIFPMVIFEGKVTLLTNTYFKTIRKEQIILKINVVTVLISLVTTFIFTVVLNNLTLSMLNIVVLLAFKSIVAEVMLSRIINIDVKKDILLEFLMALIFILVSWFIPSYWGAIIYLNFYIIYIFIKREDITVTFEKLKVLLK